MKKLTLLIAAGTLWLFLAAVPAFADGGPHTSSINNGVTSLTADSCAGCHRVHTAKGPLLLNQTSEEELCLSCHGAASTGATTDVVTGLQYVPTTSVKNPRGTADLGALRGGGFEEARIGDPFRFSLQTSATGGSSRLGKVTVSATAEAVTSAHMPGLAGLTQPGIAWGNGANGSGAGPAADVSCGSCHNPHGNGQYRILNTIPGATGIDATWGAGQYPTTALTSVIGYGTATANAAALFTTGANHNLAVNNQIVVAGNSTTAANRTLWIDTIVSPTEFTAKTSLPGVTPVVSFKLAAGTGTGGTVLPQGVALVSYSNKVYTTAASHGLLIGDNVTVSGNALGAANVTGTVATVPSDLTFTITGVTDTTTAQAGGKVIRNGGVRVTDAAAPPAADARNYTVIQTVYTAPTLLASQALAFDPLDGDYFHYRVPWNDPSSTTNNYDAPNAIPGGGDGVANFAGGFGEQMAAWCTSCHSRYYAWSEPTEDPNDGSTTGPAYSNPRPGDAIFSYQHRTRGASGRGCLTCHVSHGSNAQMTGEYSANFTFPDGSVAVGNSRLLKIDNRGTCQQCHEPTGTSVAGDQFPSANVKWTLVGVDANNKYTTSAANTLQVGDQVNIAGITSTDWTANGQFFVSSILGNDFTVSKTLGGAEFDVLAAGTGGSVGIIPPTP